MVDKALADNPLATLWIAKCTVTELGQGTDPITKVQWFEEVETIKDEPCRVSYATSTKNDTTRTETITIAPQEVTLFIRPDLVIPAGSRITVTQYDRTVEYRASGVPRVHTLHQEIPLTLWDDRA